MGYVFAYFQKVALIAAGAGITWALATVAGPWVGFVIWAMAIGVGCAVGAFLLSRAPAEQITWRNRVAGFLLPWGYALGRGKLAPIGAAAWAIWVLIGLGAVLVFRSAHPAGAVQAAAPSAAGAHWVIAGCLFACWALYGALILRLIGHTSGRQRMLKPIGVMLVLVGVSVALWLNGRPGTALVLAAAPIVAIGGGYGLLLCVMLASGRKARWN
jgi:hypothetical protein